MNLDTVDVLAIIAVLMYFAWRMGVLVREVTTIRKQMALPRVLKPVVYDAKNDIRINRIIPLADGGMISIDIPHGDIVWEVFMAEGAATVTHCKVRTCGAQGSRILRTLSGETQTGIVEMKPFGAEVDMTIVGDRLVGFQHIPGRN